MQPHGGKREGLYTGFKVLMNDPEIDVIVTTDSDTILDENSVTELAYQCRKEEVGAVAGQIGIWNTSESILTHIVSYRYWLSFNLERASESFWGTVLCVAGPMACYKVDVLKNIMDGWYDQTFMGEKCTFGDDRHLTNRVLKEGKKVVYTSHAIGYTDTPSDWGRYFIQQTRWSKSYFREFFYNMQSVHLHSLWMAYELCYNFVYFFLLMYWSLYILYFCSVYQKSVAVLMTLGVGLIKSLYGAIKTKKVGFMYFMLYSFVYFLVIIPAKIAAIVTVWDTRWGTRGKNSTFLHSYWSVILWLSTLAGGFIYTTLKNKDFNYETDYRYKIAFIGWFVYTGFLMLSLVVEYVCRRVNLFSNELEIDIKRERKSIEFNK
jgi:hyaluronan synthase